MFQSGTLGQLQLLPDHPHAASEGTITTRARAGEQEGEAIRNQTSHPVVCPELIALANKPDLTAKAM